MRTYFIYILFLFTFLTGQASGQFGSGKFCRPDGFCKEDPSAICYLLYDPVKCYDDIFDDPNKEYGNCCFACAAGKNFCKRV